MCNNTQKKKAAGAGKDFTLFFGVILHFNFKCEYSVFTHVVSICAILWQQKKFVHKKRVVLPQDLFGTTIWPPFHCSFLS